MECSALKRAIEIVYAATLPKASKPFVYMSINLPREHVDINIHPTKKEVIASLHLLDSCLTISLIRLCIYCLTCLQHEFLIYRSINKCFGLAQVSLLNQEIMIEMIQSEVELKLRNTNDTRTFEEQVCVQKNFKQIFLVEVKNIYINSYKGSIMVQKVEYIQSTLKSSRSDTPVSPLPSGTESFSCVLLPKTFCRCILFFFSFSLHRIACALPFN